MSEQRRIGAIGEQIAITQLIKEGWSVAKPYPDIGIDILAVKLENGKLRTRNIQVKSSFGEKRYRQIKNIRREKSHNLYGFTFKKIMPNTEYWFVFSFENREPLIKILSSEELSEKIDLPILGANQENTSNI